MCIGFMFSEKTPMVVNATAQKRKIVAPDRPTTPLLKLKYNPVANSIESIPLIMRPVLNMMSVGHVITPRSLKALFVQLNLGAKAIADNMNAKATKGVATAE